MAEKSIKVPAWLIGTIISVFVYLLGFAVSWGYQQAQISQLQKIIDRQQKMLEGHEKRIRDTELSSVAKDAQIHNISVTLGEIKQSIEDLRNSR